MIKQSKIQVKAKITKQISLPYIAGYTDGEGSIQARHPQNRPHPQFLLRIANTHLETLQKIKDFFGVGNIHQLKPPPNATKPYYQWVTGARLDIIFVLELLIPYLIEKKEKAQAVLDEAKSLVDMRHVWKGGCRVKGCNGKHLAKGFCSRHYESLVRRRKIHA